MLGMRIDVRVNMVKGKCSFCGDDSDREIVIRDASSGRELFQRSFCREHEYAVNDVLRYYVYVISNLSTTMVFEC